MTDARSHEVPPYHALMWPTLCALKAMGGSAGNEELLEVIIQQESIPEDVAAAIHTDGRQTRLSYNLAWAKTYLKRVGALDNSVRAVWSITDVGEAMTVEDMASIPARVRRQDYDRRRQSESEQVEPPLAVDEPAPPETSWKDQLLAVLRSMAPDAFERLSQRVLREAGFTKVDVTGRSGDGGIDGIGVLRVNLLSFQVLFQCKRYQGTVAPREIRDFRGAMVGRSDKGLFITTGTFSTEARREATRDGAPVIDLIDGDHLCDLLKSLGLGVRSEVVERVTVEPDWYGRV